jgi:hypothetical protein
MNNSEQAINIKNFNILKGKLYSLNSQTPMSNSIGKNKLSNESLTSFGTINGITSINNFNKKRIFNLNKNSTINRTNKNENLFTTNLKKKILDRRDNMNNTLFSREYIQAKDINYVPYNKSFLEMNMVTPTIKRVDTSQLNNVVNMTSTSSDFYGKIFPIKQSWNYEISNIIIKGYNGYINKKYKEINIAQGHVESKGDNSLLLYGNCLRILTQKEYFEKIKLLSFNYFCYDFIMSRKMIKYIKEFKNLISIKFSNNNIYSFYQLTKLESLDKLEKVTIVENEICNAFLLKYFIVYRLNTLKNFNNQIIEYSDKNMSKNIFKYFDILISIKEKEVEKEKQKQKEETDNNDIIINSDNLDDDKEKFKFFDYAKFNLSIAIEEIIQDEIYSDV